MKMVENCTTDCWNKLSLEVVRRNAADVWRILEVVVAAEAGHLETHGNVGPAVRENGEVEGLETEPDDQVHLKKRAAVVVRDSVEDGDGDE